MGKYATKEQLTALVADMASKINIASGTQGVSGSYVPIGCIEAFMGVEAPPDFLVCDGSLHSIASYPQLADHFYEQFGASNHFGGNGTTTFAVPDLRGEFLRGTGTNSHTNQGDGEDVGDHQDATDVPHVCSSGNNIMVWGTIQAHNYDKAEESSSRKIVSATAGADSNVSNYTVRPTNTSVLWCIKAIDEKIQPGGGGIDYSTEEQDTGLKWIDGKPIYQKTVTGTVSGVETILDSNITSNNSLLIDAKGYLTNSVGAHYLLGYSNGSYYQSGVILIPNGARLDISGSAASSWFYPFAITLQYVKL